MSEEIKSPDGTVFKKWKEALRMAQAPTDKTDKAATQKCVKLIEVGNPRHRLPPSQPPAYPESEPQAPSPNLSRR